MLFRFHMFGFTVVPPNVDQWAVQSLHTVQYTELTEHNTSCTVGYNNTALYTYDTYSLH